MAPVLFIHGNKILEERWGHAGSTFNKFTKGGSGPAAAVAPAAAIRRWCESAPPLIYLYIRRWCELALHHPSPSHFVICCIYICFISLPWTIRAAGPQTHREINLDRACQHLMLVCQHCANTVPTPVLVCQHLGVPTPVLVCQHLPL